MIFYTQLSSRPIHRSSGFTLLEVLIALAILALSSLAILRQTGQSTSQLYQLKDKNVAAIVAENHLTILNLQPQWPDTGSSANTISFNGKQWIISTEVSSTPDNWLRKIEVSVAINEKPNYAIVNLTAYRGLH